MIKYSASVRTNRGSTVAYPVSANDRRSAARELSMSPARVLDVKVDWVSTIRSATQVSAGPSPTEQAIFLLNLAAQLTGGKRSIGDVFDAYLSKDKRFKVDPIKKEKAIEIEDYLDALGFDRNVMILAQAGRESGDLSGALKEAAEFLQEEEARKGAIFKKIAMGLFYSSSALGMVVFGSMGFSSQLREMEKTTGLPFNYNFASDVLFALDHFFNTYGPFMLGIVALAFFFRKPIIKAADSWPLISTVNRITRLQRGIKFISLFSLMRQSKKGDKAALEYIASHATGDDAEIFNRLAAVRARGQPLHAGFRDDDWSPTVMAGLSQLEEMDDESALNTMRAILSGQKQELSKAGESLATSLQLVGMVSLVVTIVVVVAGFLLPIMNVASSPSF